MKKIALFFCAFLVFSEDLKNNYTSVSEFEMFQKYFLAKDLQIHYDGILNQSHKEGMKVAAFSMKIIPNAQTQFEYKEFGNDDAKSEGKLQARKSFWSRLKFFQKKEKEEFSLGNLQSFFNDFLVSLEKGEGAFEKLLRCSKKSENKKHAVRCQPTDKKSSLNYVHVNFNVQGQPYYVEIASSENKIRYYIQKLSFQEEKKRVLNSQ